MDRTKAIDILRVIAPPRTSKKAFYDFMETRDMAIEALEQTLPLRRGKWIRDGFAYYCSECKKRAHIDYNPFDISSPGALILSDFCPHCGADMREK